MKEMKISMILPMNNITVKALIKMLEKADLNAVVCKLCQEDDGGIYYSSFEIVKPLDKTAFIDSSGDTQTGSIVAIF